MGVGVREQHHRERADGSDAHQEVLVEHLAAPDVLHRFPEHVVTRDQVGDEEQAELDPDRGGAAAEPFLEWRELGERHHREEQDQRNDDAREPSFLLG